MDYDAIVFATQAVEGQGFCTSMLNVVAVFVVAGVLANEAWSVIK